MNTVLKSLKKLLAILMLISVFFVILSIITFNSSDGSYLNYKTTNENVGNIFGIYGANISVFLIQIFGLSFLLPIYFFSILSIKILKEISIKYLTLRVTIMLLGIMLLSLILSLSTHYSLVEEISLGGVLGDYLKQILLLYFDKTLLLSSGGILFTFIFIICTGIKFHEWVSVLNFIKNVTTYVIKFLILTIFKSLKVMSMCLLKKKKNSFKILNSQKKNNYNKLLNKVKHNLIGHDNLPPVNILRSIDSVNSNFLEEDSDLQKKMEKLKQSLKDYGIEGEISSYKIGPVITLFELKPAPGTKSSRVFAISEDIARSMSALSIRISIIPGKNTIGIEIPNNKRQIISLKELIKSQEYNNSSYNLPVVLGKTVIGKPMIADLSKMPHLLLAGTTGSGKSMAINTMILSLLYSCTIRKCRFIMIDPKILELSSYNGIPNLLCPVITKPDKAIEVLEWIIQKMDYRYKAMSCLGVRNITVFNQILSENGKKKKNIEKFFRDSVNNKEDKNFFNNLDLVDGEMPYIVVIIDEIADLMLVAGKNFENGIQRIVQMARASGIHLVIATQRPSVDIITGVIKANFPTRISFQVTSKIDSRTILGEQGAEKLIGKGDMLYMVPGDKITRIHSPFVSDIEIENIVRHLKMNNKKKTIF